MAGVLLSLPPVLLFLIALVFMDSFKLVTRRAMARSLLVGSVAAFLAWYLNVSLLEALALPKSLFSRYVAPVTEELLKAAYVVYLMKKRRVGFLVDAGIHGFAIGAGFALVENVYYLGSLGEASWALWVVRSFGTALLHGTTTSIFAMASKTLSDRHPVARAVVFVPGLTVAVLVHSLFNHFILHPVLVTLLLIVILPLLMIGVFERSRKSTWEWLQADFEGDALFMSTILSGEVERTRVGEYLRSLKSRFAGTVVADMLCLIRIHLELSLRGKGLLIAREAGLGLPVGEDVRANLEELKYLEKAIGPTGLLAVQPLLKRSTRDLWQLYMLEQAGG